MMKRILSIILCTLLIVSLVGCKNEPANYDSKAASSITETVETSSIDVTSGEQKMKKAMTSLSRKPSRQPPKKVIRLPKPNQQRQKKKQLKRQNRLLKRSRKPSLNRNRQKHKPSRNQRKNRSRKPPQQQNLQ